MSTIFRAKFPRSPWRAAERTERSPELFIDSSDYWSDDVPTSHFVGSTFADESVNQGRGPSGSAWPATDALIASIAVAVVAWVALGCPT